MTKIRTLQIIGAPKAGGAETFYLRFVEALHKSKEAEVLPLVRQKSWIATELQKRNIPHETAPFRHPKWLDVTTAAKIKKLAKNADIAQVWMNRAAEFLPPLTIPTVGRLGGYYKLKNYQTCNHLVGNTQDLKTYFIQQGWPKEKAHYLPNFVPIPPENWQQSRADMRKKLNISEEDTAFLIAGRLHPNKGIDLALRALAALPKTAVLLIAGEGAEQQRLQTLAEKLGVAQQISWLGWQSNISAIAAAADIWLVPSRIEPLGNVVLEAWAHHKPVIAAAAVGPKALIEHEQNGALVGLENPVQLAEYCQHLMENKQDAAHITQGGAQTFKKHFAEPVIMQQWLDFYKSLVKEPKKCAA